MVLEIDQVFNFPASIHPGLSTKHTTRVQIQTCLHFNSKVPQPTQRKLWSVDNTQSKAVGQHCDECLNAGSVGYQASMLITWHAIT